MTRYVIALCAALLFVGCGGTPQQPQAKAPVPDTARPAATEVLFGTDVQAILSDNCLPCHSGTPDAKSKYDLSRYEGVLANVVAGKADSSKLFAFLNQGKMPPTGKLDSTKLAAVRRWINEGAKNN